MNLLYMVGGGFLFSSFAGNSIMLVSYLSLDLN